MIQFCLLNSGRPLGKCPSGLRALRAATPEDVHVHEDPPRAGEVHVVRVLPLRRLVPLRLHLPPGQVRTRRRVHDLEGAKIPTRVRTLMLKYSYSR